uniref:Uncharacterized protein n=1 Tax=Anguilla anguilla TaxID=7936 RepID=A0A0E9WP67_ANGAN
MLNRGFKFFPPMNNRMSLAVTFSEEAFQPTQRATASLLFSAHSSGRSNAYVGSGRPYTALI